MQNRPSLIDYNPVANPAAIVTSPDGMARFTVLTDRVIRMEYAKRPGQFEDRECGGPVLPATSALPTRAVPPFSSDSTIAIMNRNTPLPQFGATTKGGVLNIKTASVSLSYTLGQPFSNSSLSVASLDSSSAFKGWSYGQAFPGNLLGTIRGRA